VRLSSSRVALARRFSLGLPLSAGPRQSEAASRSSPAASAARPFPGQHPGLVHVPGEDVQVQSVRGDPHQIAGRPGGDGGVDARVGQHLAQPGDADLHLGTGRGRRALVPDEIDQMVDADDAVRVQQQRGQHGLLPPRRDAHLVTVGPHFEGPQDVEAGLRFGPAPLAPG
jgi:hypothetical protein